jgi:hypothetical protein
MFYMRDSTLVGLQLDRIKKDSSLLLYGINGPFKFYCRLEIFFDTCKRVASLGFDGNVTSVQLIASLSRVLE